MPHFRLRALSLGLACCAALTAPAAAERLDEALYAEILQRHTRAVPDAAGTRVDYRALGAAPEWRALRANVSRTRPQELAGRAERLAYWINVYNIFALDLVAQHHPVASIKDVGSLFRPVWRREAGRIDGRSYSLHEIEHEILRPLGDPRIHTAIVCASISCPALRREPWTAAQIEAQLDAALRGFLADARKGLRLDGNTLRLSRIFDWFSQDFEAGGGVLAFAGRYGPDGVEDWLVRAGPDPDVDYLDYDWRLNDLATAPDPR